MKNLFLVGIFFGCLYGTFAKAQNSFRAIFYNVENLFDCTHDTLKNDREFLPGSMRAWHYGRYRHKIQNIAKTITAAGQWSAPDLVGLCEVENEQVMNDLTRHSPLKEQGYKYIMTDSPDERGIDVALLYQRGSFRLLNYRSIRIYFKEENRSPTRDILHVSGLISTQDTLDVFVVHFPSRSEGEKESEPARLFVASELKKQTDSLFLVRAHPNIIIMGDFNDYPNNRSVSEVLRAKSPDGIIIPRKLYNLMADKKGGSYKYRGEWGILDQLIVSGFMLQNKQGLHTSPDKAGICNFPFLLEEDKTYGGTRPFRTYNGYKYNGGFSDHLPVSVNFELP